MKRAGAKTKKDVTSVSHDEVMRRHLREDREFVVEYLKAALEDADEPSLLLIALRRVAEARGGIAKVAKLAGIASALGKRQSAPLDAGGGHQSRGIEADRGERTLVG